MDYRNKFKKFGGEFIVDVVDYIKDYVAEHPSVTISVGCDSVQRRRKTIYAITIMMYETDIKNGAHVIFFREHINKVRDHFERLQKESEYALKVAEMLDTELSSFYQRKDLTDKERKRYKYHTQRCQGEHQQIQYHNEEAFINNITLSDGEKNFNYKLVDIHVDYNPQEGVIDKKGMAKNRSNLAYKAYVPWLRGLGFRVFAKPIGFASTGAADLLLQK